ncbi:MAG: endolytic transglycosylase MltG [Minisyncoccia bacterium]
MDYNKGKFSTRFASVLLLAIFFIIAIAYFFYGLQPSNMTNPQNININIAKGESFKDISADLSRNKVIKSVTVFKIYSLLSGKAQLFKPGNYVFNTSMSIPQIVNLLVEGVNNIVKVVIPEGYTLKDINTLLINNQVLNSSSSLLNYDLNNLASSYQFLNNIHSLEGFLSPDTYFFNINSSPDVVLHKLLDNFQSKIWPSLQNITNWYDKLIVASILEKELSNFKDRQIAAGIIYKRLENKIPIQIDATLTYAKCNGEIQNCENLKLTKKDLQMKSVYNTYNNLGLPPTPVSNPGLDAIKAALQPEQSPYWFYLATNNGTYFAKTLSEQNKNIAKYLNKN